MTRCNEWTVAKAQPLMLTCQMLPRFPLCRRLQTRRICEETPWHTTAHNINKHRQNDHDEKQGILILSFRGWYVLTAYEKFSREDSSYLSLSFWEPKGHKNKWRAQKVSLLPRYAELLDPYHPYRDIRASRWDYLLSTMYWQILARKTHKHTVEDTFRVVPAQLAMTEYTRISPKLTRQHPGQSRLWNPWSE